MINDYLTSAFILATASAIAVAVFCRICPPTDSSDKRPFTTTFASLVAGFILLCGGIWAYWKINPPIYSLLSGTRVDGNVQYRRLAEPSRKQVELGKQALRKWNLVSKAERNELAPVLVLSRVLIGMSGSDVFHQFGPGDCPAGSTTLRYDLREMEDQFDLCLVMKDDRVVDVYLDFNG